MKAALEQWRAGLGISEVLPRGCDLHPAAARPTLRARQGMGYPIGVIIAQRTHVRKTGIGRLFHRRLPDHRGPDTGPGTDRTAAGIRSCHVSALRAAPATKPQVSIPMVSIPIQWNG